MKPNDLRRIIAHVRNLHPSAVSEVKLGFEWLCS